MAEYIEREKVYDIFGAKQQELLKYYRYYQLNDADKEEFDLYDSYMNEVERIPTADVESVVRCRDCKYYEKKTGFCLKHSYFKDSDGMSCSPADSRDFTFFNEDDFCSYGKTKDGETE